MDKVRCPQCEKPLSNSTCRLVQDACGHKKCRICLLEDEESCYQCKSQTSVITKRSDTIIEQTETITMIDSKQIGNETLIKEARGAKDSTAAVNEIIGNVKTVRKTDMNAKKRNYQTIVIPNHITTLKDPVSYKCNVCNKVFLTKSHVKYHMYCKGGKM